jgi:hypothetical protein
MIPIFIAPFVIVILLLSWFVGNYFIFFVRDGGDDYEHDGNQSTRIRHEWNL